MKTPSLVLSEAAVSDILEQADWYRQQSGPALARRWEKAVTSTVLGILQHPAAAPPCNFRSVELREVRRAAIAGFPKHLLFYKFH